MVAGYRNRRHAQPIPAPRPRDRPIGRAPIGADVYPAQDAHTLALPAAARRFQGQPAGVVSRLLAAVIDFAVVAGIFAAGYLAVSGVIFLWAPVSFSFPAAGRTVVVAGVAALLWAYLTVSWATTGRTVGDDVVGLRVVGRRGGHPALVIALARALLCLIFPIGLLWCAVSERNESLQDVVLRTSVRYAW